MILDQLMRGIRVDGTHLVEDLVKLRLHRVDDGDPRRPTASYSRCDSDNVVTSSLRVLGLGDFGNIRFTSALEAVRDLAREASGRHPGVLKGVVAEASDGL